MTNYQVVFTKASEKYLKKTDRITRERIIEAIYKLSINPYEFDGNTTKLKATNNECRIQVGKYRIVYEVIDDKVMILILIIDSRGGVYKKL